MNKIPFVDSHKAFASLKSVLERSFTYNPTSLLIICNSKPSNPSFVEMSV